MIKIKRLKKSSSVLSMDEMEYGDVGVCIDSPYTDDIVVCVYDEGFGDRRWIAFRDKEYPIVISNNEDFDQIRVKLCNLILGVKE